MSHLSTRPSPSTPKVMTRKAAEDLRVGYGAPDGVRGKWVAVVRVEHREPFLASRALMAAVPGVAGYDNGTPSSFHDARFEDALVFAFGASPSRARRHLKRALTALAAVPVVVFDSASQRAALRNLVREGD